GFDLGAANLAEEGALAINPVAEEAHQQQDEDEAREVSCFLESAGMALEHIAEEPPDQGYAEAPEQRATGVVGDEGEVGHPALPGDRRRHSAKPGYELGNQQRAAAIALKEIAGAPHAGG